MKKTIRPTTTVTREDLINPSTITRVSGIAGAGKSSSEYETLAAKGIAYARFTPTGRLRKECTNG